MEHHFNVEVATKYGMLEAVLLENFYFWTMKNEANKINYQNGMYWTYNSIPALCELFPYASEKKIRNAIKKLKDEGLIITGQFNTKAYDRTTWYALTEAGKDAQSVENTHLPSGADGCAPQGRSIRPIGQMDAPSGADGSALQGGPIPYNKPVNKPDSKHIYMALMESYNSICTSLPKCIKMTDERRRHLKARLESHSEDDIKMAFIKAEESDFLSGREKDWHANFDWIIKNEDNLVKILEGHYDNRDHVVTAAEHELSSLYEGADEEKLKRGREVLQ